MEAWVKQWLLYDTFVHAKYNTSAGKDFVLFSVFLFVFCEKYKIQLLQIVSIINRWPLYSPEMWTTGR